MSNTGAQELYRRFGFAPAGVRKNYYSDTNEDALIMWANDIDTPEYRARLARHRAARCPRRRSWEDCMTDRPRFDSDVHTVLGIESSCDETAAGRRPRRHQRAVVGDLVPGRPPRPLRRRRARDRVARPRRDAQPGVGRGHRAGRRRRRRHRCRGRHLRPRPRRLVAGRRVGGQGAGPRVGRAVRGRQPPRGPSLRRHARGPDLRAPRRRPARVRAGTR